ncbi:MAG TPA: 4-hydroxybutyrate CoA-transferase [Clostridiales bacterium]|nr:4-hydroxybutyrate CoA-transferase [Clostridiales bacterium]
MKQAKKVDAQTALSVVKDGDTVAIGHACCEPQHLVRALCARNGELKDIRTTHMVDMGEGFYTTEEASGTFRHCSLFVGGNSRKAIAEGRADFIPVHFSRIPELFWENYVETDVALVQVSPPDAHGWMSLGVSVDYTYAAAHCAKTVVAQVNKNCPRTHGQSFLHVSEVDYLVEYDEPMIELKRAALSEVDRKIGQNCARLVRDGDTLQLGIGSLPDAVLASLMDKNDLGIHSEMFSDGVAELARAGVITNRRKNYMRGKYVATFLMGSRKLYDFVDDNPAVFMAPADYTNDPYVIGQNDNLVSINSCIEIDLTGQVCAESAGLRQISSTGGQVDFIRGAALSKGGRAIIAMPSTTKDGKTSKIVAALQYGGTVTSLRTDVSYVATEYGIANLKGKTARERGRELIGIAHPDFRDALIEEWEKRHRMKF